jgi:hypothetical protein
VTTAAGLVANRVVIKGNVPVIGRMTGVALIIGIQVICMLACRCCAIMT